MYNKIKFSKEYRKLPPDANGRLARLLFVHKIKLENQSEWFVKYDTESIDGSHYELPKKGDYLFLLYELTDWTVEKEKYYRSLEGQFLEVVVTNGL
jgi:hypothetical protein